MKNRAIDPALTGMGFGVQRQAQRLIIQHTLSFKKRGWLGAVLLVPVLAIVVLSRPLVGHDTPLDHAIESLGWLSFLVYLLLRVWATMYVGDRKDKVLQTQGPYSLCRNPLYLGSFFCALSMVMFLHSATLLTGVAAIGFIYARMVIPSEETVLAATFGSLYEQYARRTPRLLPRPWGYKSGESVNVSLPGMRREIKRVLITSILIIGAFLSCHLRSQSWWPHYFTLP